MCLAPAIVNYHKQIGHNRSFIMGEIDRVAHRWTISIYIGNDTHINMLVVANFWDQLTITAGNRTGSSVLHASPLMLNSDHLRGDPRQPGDPCSVAAFHPRGA